VHRAINVGVSVVLVSVHGKRDVEEIVEVTFDTHRPFVYNLKDRRRDEPEVVRQEIADNTLVVPCLECDQALSEIDEILTVPNLRMIQLDLLDLSKLWGFLLEYDSEEMWTKLQPIIDRCRQRNIKILTNLGTTEYSADWPRVWAKRIKRFYEGGFQVITAGSPTKMLRLSTQSLSEELRNCGAKVGIGDATTLRTKPRIV
jgi:2-keto-3-deoxy-L-rhamnonate aldolase RhmA